MSSTLKVLGNAFLNLGLSTNSASFTLTMFCFNKYEWKFLITVRLCAIVVVFSVSYLSFKNSFIFSLLISSTSIIPLSFK